MPAALIAASSQIPRALGQALLGIELFALIMAVLVWARWRKRRADGFAFGTVAPSCPLTGSEFGQLTALLLLVYSLFLLLSFILVKSGFLQGIPQRVLLLIICQNSIYAILLAALVMLLKQKGGAWRGAFGFGSGGLKNVLVTSLAALGAVLIPLQLAAGSTRVLFHLLDWPLKPQAIILLLLQTRDPWLFGGLVTVAVAGAPVAEELFFRGLLYPWLKQRMGFGHALWINSILFAATHWHPASFFPLFILGMAFTLLYEWRGNLGACILFHAGFNSLSLASLFLLKNLVP